MKSFIPFFMTMMSLDFLRANKTDIIHEHCKQNSRESGRTREVAKIFIFIYLCQAACNSQILMSSCFL